MRNVLIGVAWPYSNDVMHIGNVVGSLFPADIVFRFHKLLGDKVMMVSGTDAYGTPTTLKADELGITPEEVANRYYKEDLDVLKKLSIDFVEPSLIKGLDHGLFTSTSTDNHKKIVQEMFLNMLENDYILRKTTEQLYCEKEDKFLQDRYIEGKCPHCGYDKARGDQCESCGRVLDPLEIIDPISKSSGEKLSIKETENYFIDLPKLSDFLEKYLTSENFVENNSDWVQKEALGWLKEGLKPRAITRDMKYGVPLPIDRIPEDKRIEDIENKVFYVWFEAVMGYYTAPIEYSKLLGQDELWRDFYYGENIKSYLVLGQDNVVFHTINWQAQLYAAYGDKIHMPDTVLAQKFLMLEGKKLSKSAGWIIPWDELFENFEVDSIRFYLAHNLPENKQANWSWGEFKDVINGELVGKIGNFVHRILTFTRKNFGEKIEGDYNVEVADLIARAFDKARTAIEENRSTREYVQAVIHLAREANLYVDNNKFWELAKTDENRCKEVLYNCLNIVNALGILLWPLCPDASDKIDAFLGLSVEGPCEGKDLFKYEEIPSDYSLADEILPIFKKIEDEDVEKMLEGLKS